MLEAADREKLVWDDVAGPEDSAAYALLLPDQGVHERLHAQPDWKYVHRELARVGVKLKLLHSQPVGLVIELTEAAVAPLGPRV
ncbi:hypothetical protein GCM10022381_12820 [Leifsonia kafniensis]|uniref:Uncharacterized protein n=1 Tax=Leifsonia kafniensis TaxID=475957 RepID=A0ABP7KC47_9MICO